MPYSNNDILTFIAENDVKFIRLAFCDVFGNLKNIAIMPQELPRALSQGIPFDASALSGMVHTSDADLLLFPDISTITLLPWRPKTGRVVRLFCDIRTTDGNPYVYDVRYQLKELCKETHKLGYDFGISSECEFYLFSLDENGVPTKTPLDNASYLDTAPLDKCENIRREICLTLEEMGFKPETSRHEFGPGQNEIDFKKSDLLTAADNFVHFKAVVKTIASQNGCYASFMPKPIPNQCGSGLHINIFAQKDGKPIFNPNVSEIPPEGRHFIAGILDKIRDITCFLNPTTNSYKRFGEGLAPLFVNWSAHNRSQLIRIPFTDNNNAHIEVRSPDAACNPYIALKLLILAGIDGIENKLSLCSEYIDSNNPPHLPLNFNEACKLAKESDFVKKNLNAETVSPLYNAFDFILENYNAAEDKDFFDEKTYFNSHYFNAI